MIEKISAALACILVSTLLLAGCGGDKSSSASSPAPASSASVSQPASSQPDGSSTASSGHDVDAILGTLSEAAGLGGTIELGELDLKANGINVDDIEEWAGAESKLSSENGGIVIVFVTKPGTSKDLVSALSAMRDTRATDDRYAEFETARENTKDARIVTIGDNLVVYAVSATGADGYGALDEAIDSLNA